MTPEDERTATHLSRIGVNPVVVARLAEWAEQNEMTLREIVRQLLSNGARDLRKEAHSEA